MIRPELNLRLPNSPGALAGVCRALSDARIGIIAMALESGGQLRLVVDNAVHAVGLLRELHHQVTEREVLVFQVSNAPGGLSPVLALVAAAGVNVEYAYGSGAEAVPTTAVVLGVDDAMRASAAGL